jgi:aspartate 1-decarboxylase
LPVTPGVASKTASKLDRVVIRWGSTREVNAETLLLKDYQPKLLVFHRNNVLVDELSVKTKIDG